MEAVDSIGKRIAEYRKLKGWNQRQLAQAVGYSLSLVEKIERGVRGVERYSTLHTFARALGVDISELTGEVTRARKQREHATIPEIRRVMTAMPYGIEDGPFRSIAELRREVEAAIARRESGKYTRFGEDLPMLLEERSVSWKKIISRIDLWHGRLALSGHFISFVRWRLHRESTTRKSRVLLVPPLVPLIGIAVIATTIKHNSGPAT